jgi:hypothetical protein
MGYLPGLTEVSLKKEQMHRGRHLNRNAHSVVLQLKGLDGIRHQDPGIYLFPHCHELTLRGVMRAISIKITFRLVAAGAINKFPGEKGMHVRIMGFINFHNVILAYANLRLNRLNMDSS